MKKIVVALMCMVACVSFVACTPQETPVIPGKIDGTLDFNGNPVTAAYGELPDAPVVVDGVIDEDYWQSREYVVAENEYAKVSFTAVPTLKGVLVCGYSTDKTVVWSGRNYFTDNTHFAVKIAGAKKTYSVQCDSHNVRPTMICLNARSTYFGTLNEWGKGGGMSFELFVTWDELGFDSAQETISICASYAYAVAYKISVKQLYLTGGNNIFTTFPVASEEK